MHFRFFIFFNILLLTFQQCNGKQAVTQCFECPPGWGVLKKCSRIRNTACEKCERSVTYSSVSSSMGYFTFGKCWPCSQCGIGLYESQSCTPTKDTVCNECINMIGKKEINPLNKDFLQKCYYIFTNNN